MQAKMVTSIDPTKAAAETMRSRVTMLRYCLAGPTRKQVATTAAAFPNVNIKTNPDLHSIDGFKAFLQLDRILPVPCSCQGSCQRYMLLPCWNGAISSTANQLDT